MKVVNKQVFAGSVQKYEEQCKNIDEQKKVTWDSNIGLFPKIKKELQKYKIPDLIV